MVFLWFSHGTSAQEKAELLSSTMGFDPTRWAAHLARAWTHLVGMEGAAIYLCWLMISSGIKKLPFIYWGLQESKNGNPNQFHEMMKNLIAGDFEHCH